MRTQTEVLAQIAAVASMLATPCQSTNADGIAVFLANRAQLTQERSQLDEELRMILLMGQTGSNNQQTNSRWERGRPTGVGTI